MRKINKVLRFSLVAVVFVTVLKTTITQAATLDVGPSGHTYNSIQAAINAANDGDIVLVDTGSYNESINFSGKAITVQSVNGPMATAIDIRGNGSVVTFNNGEGSGSILKGFFLKNGRATTGGGIYCDSSSPQINNCIIGGNEAFGDGGGIGCVNSSSPIITNCTITGNLAGGNGGGIYCNSSSPTIINCTISGNSATSNGGGIACYSSSSPTVTNTILWSNTAGTSDNEINLDSSSINITYSDILGGYTGTGNINADPSFANARPASEAPTTDGYYNLLSDSPCIDTGTGTGAPSDDLYGDSRPQGTGLDMGSDEYVKCMINADCNDNNPCTDDTCDPVNGCEYDSNTASCNDDDPCTITVKCEDGICAGTELLTCDDGEFCTDDSCDRFQGCAYQDKPDGTLCPSDNNPCYGDVACLAGTCVNGPSPVEVCGDGEDNECNGWIDDGCNIPEFRVLVDMAAYPIEVCFVPDQPLNADPIVNLASGLGTMSPVSGSAADKLDDPCMAPPIWMKDKDWVYCVKYTPNPADTEVVIEIEENFNAPVIHNSPGDGIASFEISQDYFTVTTFCITNEEGGTVTLHDDIQCEDLAMADFDAYDLDLTGSGLGDKDCILVRIAEVDPAITPAIPEQKVSEEYGIDLPDQVDIKDGEKVRVTLSVEPPAGYSQQQFVDNLRILYYDTGTDSWRYSSAKSLLEFLSKGLAKSAAGNPGSPMEDVISDVVTNWDAMTTSFDTTLLTVFTAIVLDDDPPPNGDEDGGGGSQAASGGGCSMHQTGHNMSTGSAIAGTLILFLPIVLFGIKKVRQLSVKRKPGL